MKIAIMQPTFLPWIGYFAMIESVDMFVLLDSVQFSHRSWQQRNRIKAHSGEMILTVPVFQKGRKDQRIDEVMINYEHFSIEKMFVSLKQNYSKASYYKDYIEQLRSIFDHKPGHLADLNISLIRFFCDCLQITTPMIRSRGLQTDGDKADLLADICKLHSATQYISAPGSKVYIDESDAFSSNGIEVSYFNYNHPRYRQHGLEFIPYLSIIDLLFNEGPNSRQIVLEGVNI